MVSTLSGLNFNLYRERLRRQKYSFISILTSCCRICPTCSFLTWIHLPTGSFKPSSVLCHSLLSAVARSHTHTSLTTALTCVHSHTLWPGWKGKLRLFVPPAADWTWVLWQEIGSWVFLHVLHKKYLSTALPVGQRLEAIHKTAPPQQQIPAMLMWSNKRNFLEQILTVWESPLPSGFNVNNFSVCYSERHLVSMRICILKVLFQY